MEEIASKFSLYDFFNPIFCGCMVVVGLHLMGCSPILYIIDSINTSGYEILNLLIILLLCYLVGYILQGIGSWFGNDLMCVQSTLTKRCLCINNNKVFPDEKDHTKLDAYREKAREFYKNKGTKNSAEPEAKGNVEFTEDQCEYNYTYCSCVSQINGLDKKCEKMRALKGLSSLWMTGFAVLFLANVMKTVLILSHVVVGTTNDAFKAFLIGLACMALSVNCFFRMKDTTIKWIRMVLAVYDAYTEQINNRVTTLPNRRPARRTPLSKATATATVRCLRASMRTRTGPSSTTAAMYHCPRKPFEKSQLIRSSPAAAENVCASLPTAESAPSRRNRRAALRGR